MADAPVTLKIESDPLRKYLRGVPSYVAKGMAAAAVRAGSRYLTYHRRLRLSATQVASSGPLYSAGGGIDKHVAQARSAGFDLPGRSVRQNFIGRRFFHVTGDTIDRSTLHIVMPGGIAKAHELGSPITAKGGHLVVPMPAAKDSKGKVAKWARALLKQDAHRLNARSEGFNLVRGARDKTLVRIESGGKKYLALVKKSGKGKERLTLLFHLQKRIQQKPRLEFLRSWRGFEAKAASIYRQALPYAIRAAAKKQGVTSIALPEGLGNA